MSGEIGSVGRNGILEPNSWRVLDARETLSVLPGKNIMNLTGFPAASAGDALKSRSAGNECSRGLL